MYAMIYSRFPKGFQRVYRYLYFSFPKSIIVRQYTVLPYVPYDSNRSTPVMGSVPPTPRGCKFLKVVVCGLLRTRNPYSFR